MFIAVTLAEPETGRLISRGQRVRVMRRSELALQNQPYAPSRAIVSITFRTCSNVKTRRQKADQY